MASGIPTQVGGEFDFRRLERAVAALVERQRQLEVENSQLRDDLKEKTLLTAGLEERLLEANQSRRDAAKRIDGLIARIAQIEPNRESRSL